LAKDYRIAAIIRCGPARPGSGSHGRLRSGVRRASADGNPSAIGAAPIAADRKAALGNPHTRNRNCDRGPDRGRDRRSPKLAHRMHPVVQPDAQNLTNFFASLVNYAQAARGAPPGLTRRGAPPGESP